MRESGEPGQIRAWALSSPSAQRLWLPEAQARPAVWKWYNAVTSEGQRVVPDLGLSQLWICNRSSLTPCEIVGRCLLPSSLGPLSPPLASSFLRSPRCRKSDRKSGRLGTSGGLTPEHAGACGRSRAPLPPARSPQLAAGAPLGPPRGRLCAGPCSPAPSCPPQVPREVAYPPRRWPQAGRGGVLPALCRLRWRLSASRSPPPRTLQACSPLLPTPSHGAGAQGPAVTRGPVCRVCVAARG